MCEKVEGWPLVLKEPIREKARLEVTWAPERLRDGKTPSLPGRSEGQGL